MSYIEYSIYKLDTIVVLNESERHSPICIWFSSGQVLIVGLFLSLLIYTLLGKVPLFRQLDVKIGPLFRQLDVKIGPLLRQLDVKIGSLFRQLGVKIGSLFRQLGVKIGPLFRQLGVKIGSLFRQLDVKIGPLFNRQKKHLIWSKTANITV